MNKIMSKCLTSVKVLPSALAISYTANIGTNIIDDTVKHQPITFAQTGYT